MVEMHPEYTFVERSFEVLNPNTAMTTRSVRSPFDDDTIAAIAHDGYVVLRGFLDASVVTAFRSIIDDVRSELFEDSTRDSFRGGQFHGQYIRDLHAHRWAAWDLMVGTGLPDLVRALAGPRVVMRSYSVRITHPREKGETIWHCDQRARVSPPPPWFTDTHSVTVVGYLDRADCANGATELVPGSHRNWELPPTNSPPSEPWTTIIGEPGDVLVFHGALWHRAAPPSSDIASEVRRVLNIQFAPSWNRRSQFGDEAATGPEFDQLISEALAAGRSDVLELLGEGGYM